MTRLIHHWHTPRLDDHAAGTPVRVQSDCGRSILLTAAKVMQWKATATPFREVPDEDVCPVCLAARQADA